MAEQVLNLDLMNSKAHDSYREAQFKVLYWIIK